MNGNVVKDNSNDLSNNDSTSDDEDSDDKVDAKNGDNERVTAIVKVIIMESYSSNSKIKDTRN